MSSPRLAVEFAWRYQGFCDGNETLVAHGAKETAAPSRMASDAGLVNQQQYGVAIAVDAKFNEALNLARVLAFAPQLLARTRPVMDAAGGNGSRNRFVVHPGEHEHLARIVLLCHRRDEASLVEA
jgi:hypothetical protein